MKQKILMTLALLMTVATGAWADIAQGDVFMFGSYIDFGTSVKCKLSSGGTDNYTVAKSTKLPLTYGGYENGKHQLVFNSANATSYLYIVDTNSSKPWGIKVIGGDGSSDNPFTFSTVYDWPNNCPQELIIGTDGTCSFAMPASDATVDYDIVRDMEDATYPVEFAGIPEPADPSIGSTKLIVKKGSDGKFQFLNPITIQLIDNISGSDVDIINADGITVKVLVGDDSSGPVEYDDENPITLDQFLADTQPGFYRIKAVPTDETSPYIGTVYSYDMWLINGYEVTIPAGEMITYFKDEPLRIDEADRESIELYTISSVSETTATLSGPYDALPKNTPMLVYNKDTENAKTTYLIPCNDPDLAVTVADEFVGTLEPTTIAASDDSQNNYAFNGKNFIWVKNDLEVGANKAWLELPGASSARSITLVFSDVETGLKAMDNGQLTMDNWYDLNGRKLNAMPTKKGVYIFNGRKVVVK